ncbi:DUF4148 domain-containing protein [Ramlibacter sp.]|uniref:DUF4148 domain-containing protein n=1 Tax=Ramlibacter sp. TaxID=1917967 RepID=UPI00260685ED|nr:DUF4148 domain-containing protein [Ramlibacter sp.]MDB5954282.1 hypothetical protein [Ramlibacter sp.]
MNRKTLTAALILVAAAGSALADDITVDTTPFVGSRTRAEVRAELQQYQQQGVNPWARDYNPLQFFHSDKTRAQVTAEFLGDRDEVAASNSEDGGAAWRAAHAARPVNPVLAGEPVNAQ